MIRQLYLTVKNGLALTALYAKVRIRVWWALAFTRMTPDEFEEKFGIMRFD